MEPPASTIAEKCLDEVAAALRRGDRPRAERAVAAAGDKVPSQGLLRLAELNIRRRRWSDALWLLDQVPARDAAAEMKRRLARNLTALERHRPRVYGALAEVTPDAEVGIGATPAGRPTVVCRRPDGSGSVSLSPGGDPDAAAASATAQLRPALTQGQSIALCGVGDGYLL